MVEGSIQSQSTTHVPTENWTLLRRLKESSHPVALVFFLVFRIAPSMLYLFGMMFTSNFVLLFILVALALAADFWNVKNISGRLLVGLRWWNETSPTGESVWVFETADPQRYINPIDSKCFWIFLYAIPVVWIVFGLIAILKLELLWLLAVILALILTLTNTFAFSRCDKFSKANKIFGNVSNQLTSGILSGLLQRLFTRS